MDVDPIPKDYPTVSPYLSVLDAAGLIEFLETVFEGTVPEGLTRADGSRGHTEVRIGSSMIMLGASRIRLPCARRACTCT